ncbi:MAG TPA: ABC transporter substrate-binding protein [Thermomicrobiales bacterium]|nr:ABC transporter substrate-binding protein [Thermomicrobiales bacterium]
MKDDSRFLLPGASVRNGALDRRRLLKLGGGLAAAAVGARALGGSAFAQGATPAASPMASPAPIPQYKTDTSISGDIQFWHFWGSPVRRSAVQRIIAQFNQVYPNIKVTETAIPFSDIWNKNLAAVAAGSGMPNVIVEDRPSLPERAKNSVETDLGDLCARDGITGDAFWPFTWVEATRYNNTPYGLPYETDIRVVYYNKAAFTEAGLDPNTPPKNWDDLASFSDKLDQKDGNQLKRIGFFPTFGNVGIDQWAWNNGGHWEDKDYNATFTLPANVDALKWEKTWADRYGFPNVQALQSTFGSGTQDGFMSGKVAMIVDIQGYTSQLNFFNPKFTLPDKDENLGYGVAPITPAPGHDPASLSGGFALSIPVGSDQVDASWEFIKFMTFVGQGSWARDTYAMPTVQALAYDPVLAVSPNWEFFLQAMAYGRPKEYNPYYPNFTGDLLPNAELAVLSGDASAEDALNDAQQKAQKEIDRVRGEG